MYIFAAHHLDFSDVPAPLPVTVAISSLLVQFAGLKTLAGVQASPRPLTGAELIQNLRHAVVVVAATVNKIGEGDHEDG